jgi:hypothetical protein
VINWVLIRRALHIIYANCMQPIGRLPGLGVWDSCDGSHILTL